ncbi:Cerato-platanin-domain-containing protein [Infundibulicybe gibba]|nr:Cerato-platanin-domain-containing protein [Infundibulicybe gibba]
MADQPAGTGSLDAVVTPRHTILAHSLAGPGTDPIRLWRIKACTTASDSQQGNPVCSAATAMKFTAALTALGISAMPLVSAISLSPNSIYGDPDRSISTVSCANVLTALGFTTFGSLPSFPFIGGASVIAGPEFNSVNCGSCWELTFTSNGTTKSVNIMAINHESPGFATSEAVMDDLTGGQAEQLGRVDVTATQVASSLCGL